MAREVSGPDERARGDAVIGPQGRDDRRVRRPSPITDDTTQEKQRAVAHGGLNQARLPDTRLARTRTRPPSPAAVRSSRSLSTCSSRSRPMSSVPAATPRAYDASREDARAPPAHARPPVTPRPHGSPPLPAPSDTSGRPATREIDPSLSRPQARYDSPQGPQPDQPSSFIPLT